MATYKEIADYIYTLPEEKQKQSACFCNLDDYSITSLIPKNIKSVTIHDLLGSYHVIAVSDHEIDESYNHYIE